MRKPHDPQKRNPGITSLLQEGQRRTPAGTPAAGAKPGEKPGTPGGGPIGPGLVGNGPDGGIPGIGELRIDGAAAGGMPWYAGVGAGICAGGAESAIIVFIMPTSERGAVNSAPQPRQNLKLS